VSISIRTSEDLARLFSRDVSNMFFRVMDSVLEHNRTLHPDNVLALATSVAVYRAELLGRDPMPVDVEFVLSMLCWWPFKPPPSPEYREFVKTNIVTLLATGDAYGAAEAFSPTGLLLPIETLHQLMAAGGAHALLFR
jgi:hypothetical protein